MDRVLRTVEGDDETGPPCPALGRRPDSAELAMEAVGNVLGSRHRGDLFAEILRPRPE
jgi:hypothetical protein